MTKNILLTGGFGTLGGRIAAELSKSSEFNLRLATRVKRDAPAWAPHAEVCLIDFEDEKSIAKMVDEMTHCVHLAALNDYECRANPEKAQLVNVEYTRRLIQQASRVKNLRFTYLSTIQVYGNNLAGRITESTKTNPMDAYSKTHLAAEDIVQQANHAQEIEGIRLRSANGFGTPMSPDAKIWQIIANDLCRQAVETKTLTLKSPGLQYRNFVSFTDICSAIIHLVQMPSTQIRDGLFNLGGSKSLQIIQMTKIIATRCAAVLDFLPTINKPDLTTDEIPPNFEFCSDKILSTGLNLTNNIENEIDILLKNCHTWFGAKN